MTPRPRVAVLIRPERRYENIDEQFFERIGDHLDLRMLESSDPAPEEVAALIRDADALVTGWGTPDIAPEAIAAAPDLKLVVHAQGSVKSLPYQAILKKGIILTNSAHAYARTMAEVTLGLMLALGYHVRVTHELYTCERTTAFDRKVRLGIGLEGKAVGIIGLGPIGALVAEMLGTFKANLFAYDPYVDPIVAKNRKVTLLKSVDELARHSQILTVHCGWTEETTGMVGRAALEQLGPRGMFVCNARMPIVDEEALHDLVVGGRLYAALNLIPLREDLWMDPRLKGLPNLLLTHPSSNVSDTWYAQVSRNVANQLLGFFDGKAVSPQLTLQQISRST